jgi:hypothetical protein
MRDRTRTRGDAGISEARSTRPMNWRAVSRTHHYALRFKFRISNRMPIPIKAAGHAKSQLM